MLDAYFKNEERARGEDLRRSVALQGSSDTGVRAYVDKCKVTLVSDGIQSPELRASCTCAAGRKGRLCAHIWALVLKLEGSDFLSEKNAIAGTEAAPKPVNARQVEFRQRRAELARERMKEIRREKKRTSARASVPVAPLPEEVEEARAFFSANGFPLDPLDLESVLHAKKLLSRVFHPDKGGSHDEVLELNHHFDIIAGYLKS